MMSNNFKKSESGFSLIELMVVIAGLGILSSFAISNVIKYFDYANVDEAKSLLNSAAADCLQNLRRKGDETLAQAVDSNIISQERLENTGYKFQDSGSTDVCGNVLITAITEAKKDRMPDLGFTIDLKGNLIKLAVDTGTDTSYAAKSWAGKNVTEAAGLKELMEYNKEILDAKASCIDDFNNWLKKSGDGMFNTWNDVATSGCPSKPPKVVSSTCTVNGCNSPIYALDKSIVGNTQEAYDAAFKAKYDALCAGELVKKREANATTASEAGEQLTNCGQKKFWFFEGENVGSSDAWRKLQCTSNKEKLLGTTFKGTVTYCDTSPIYICGGKEIVGENSKANYEACLTEDKNAICTTALNSDVLKRGNGGPYTSPTPSDMSAPVGDDCNVQYWYCTKSKKTYRSQEDYDADKQCKTSCKSPDSLCDRRTFYRHPACVDYNTCMGRI